MIIINTVTSNIPTSKELTADIPPKEPIFGREPAGGGGGGNRNRQAAGLKFPAYGWAGVLGPDRQYGVPGSEVPGDDRKYSVELNVEKWKSGRKMLRGRILLKRNV